MPPPLPGAAGSPPPVRPTRAGTEPTDGRSSPDLKPRELPPLTANAAEAAAGTAADPGAKSQPQPPSSAGRQTAGRQVDDGKGRVFPCEQCGADLEFDVGVQSLKCPFCGHAQSIEIAPTATVQEQDLLAMLRDVRERKQRSPDGETLQASEIRCDGCGGHTLFSGPLTGTECPYCGTPLQRENVHDCEERVRVDGVLPFLVDRKIVAENLQRWVQSLWFAPNEFKQRGVRGNFQGVYLPFWTFDAQTATSYTGYRGDHHTRTVTSQKADGTTETTTVTETIWSYRAGDFDHFFDDELVAASDGVPTSMLESLAPWPMDRLMPFNQQVMAGFFSRTYEVPLDKAFDIAKSRMEAALERSVRQHIGGNEQRISSRDSKYAGLTYKQLLLPVWMLAYQFKGKSYRVVMNAATGRVLGERPYSVIKIVLTVLGVIAVVGGIVGICSLVSR